MTISERIKTIEKFKKHIESNYIDIIDEYEIEKYSFNHFLSNEEKNVLKERFLK